MKRLSWKELEVINFYPKTSNSFKTSHIINPETGQVKKLARATDWNSPWDFVNNDPERQQKCGIMHLIFDTYNLIPPFCLNCWKVVVRPTTLMELFQLLELQRQLSKKDPQCWCKCGIEERMYVPGLYGGYFYNNGQSAGEQRLKQVRKEVDDHIGPHVGVILKRFCTEFEIKLGDSSEYKKQPHAQDIQDFFIMNIEGPGTDPQPALAKLNVHHNWLKFAWKFGTPEDRRQIEENFNDKEPFFRIPRNYPAQ